jgi:hypothetical protein
LFTGRPIRVRFDSVFLHIMQRFTLLFCCYASGRTVYIEPFGVVDATNELKIIRSNLEEEERRIYYDLSRTVFIYLPCLRDAIDAFAKVDVMAAKAQVGIRIQGIIPEVGTCMDLFVYFILKTCSYTF